ncbi:MAG: hypothetical protein IJO01_04455 [Oscillospiraceae bacterium]|nr:hypothetical protein [Oscillospiraceae bacterium]
MKKPVFYTELAYVFGILFIALGVALAAKVGFGVSMIAAPMYTLHLWICKFTDAITLGTLEYIFQGVIIASIALIVRKFKISYLFSFATSVFSGLAIDLMFWIVSPFQAETLFIRTIVFFASLLSCAFGVSCIFHAYISPAGNELFVKEFAGHFGKNIHKVKTTYDISFFVLSVLLNLILFQGFVGVGIGTVITAFANGPLIGMFAKFLEKHFEFSSAFPKIEKYFEK